MTTGSRGSTTVGHTEPTDTASSRPRHDQMKAAVYFGAGDVRVETVPAPQRANGQTLIRVLRSGMCGTDASEWRSGPKLFPVHQPHPVTGHVGPMILGHEFVGEVVEADPSSEFAEGDLVASGAGVSCGECDRCLEGRTNLCQRYYTLGLNTHGGMAEFVAAPSRSLVPIPGGMHVDEAGLAQPLAVGLHAARRSRVRSGDHVVLIGAGAIGTFVLAGLKSLVEADVTVVDFAGTRLDRALRLGATRIVAIGDDMDAQLKSVLPQGGADVVIEASGAPGQLAHAIGLVRPGGTVLQVGLPTGDQAVDVHSLVMREVTVETTLAHVCDVDLRPALAILQSTQLAHELLETVAGLDDVARLLEDLAHGRVEGKVLIDPTRSGA